MVVNFFFFFFAIPCGILDPWPGIELTTPALGGGVLTTGPTGLPGKFQCSGLTFSFFLHSSPVVDIPRIDFHLLRHHYLPGSVVSDVVCCCCLVDVMPTSSVTSWTVAHQAPLSMGLPGTRILEWVAISFSKGFSHSRDRTRVSCIGRQVLYRWATREAQAIWLLPWIT